MATLTVEEELAFAQEAHHRRFLDLQDYTGAAVGRAWDKNANLDDAAAAAFSAAAAVIVNNGKFQTSTLAVAYAAANDRIVGAPASGLVPRMPEIRGGIPTENVYHRSVVEARRAIANGRTYDDAMAAGRSRAVTTARTDISLANRAEIERTGESRPWVVGYRRVLTGKSCGFCATASTQRYHSAEMLPLHPSCDCDIGEIFGASDPGQIINRKLLSDLKEAGRETGNARYWDGPFMVDEKGVVRYRKHENILNPDGTPSRDKNGRIRRTSVPGRPVVTETVEHGELGATLTSAEHATKELAGDLAHAGEDLTNAADELPAPVRRTRAKLDDADVLAEANRRGITPQEVIDLREEKAARRYLEQSARDAAEKAISVDSPEVIDLAAKYGVDPEDVISARDRVADVRKLAREAAARVQAETEQQLGRLDNITIKPPPRATAKTGMGNRARGGEYDWLEQVSDREKARLSRKWYDPQGFGPDEMADNMGKILGKDLQVDDGMEAWLDLTRQNEAAGALRRGKLPSLDAYSDQIDINSILHELTDEGYDIRLLYGDDLEAAAHIASVERFSLADDAGRLLGEAMDPVHGPRPYDMSFSAWEDEVRDLEYAIKNRYASADDLARYRELVPQYLDDADVSYEELHDRIVATARKAGEEIPDLAAIQAERDLAWQTFLDETDPVKTLAKLRPADGSSNLRDLYSFDSASAERKYGPTLDRLSELHGGPVDVMDPVRIIDGGKTTQRGGYFAPEGKRPPKPRVPKGMTNRDPAYRETYRKWLSGEDWRNPQILVNRLENVPDGEQLSLLHEMGHRIDWVPRSLTDRMTRGRHIFPAPAGAVEDQALLDAMRATSTITDASKAFRIQPVGFASYFRSPEEMWARAYSQWAAEQIGGSELASLNAWRAASPGMLWTDEEFSVIGPLVENVLRARGFLA